MVQFAPTQRPLRGLRGAGLAGTSASLSVVAHTAAGGALPDPGTTALITMLLAIGSTALGDRRRGALSILCALGISQATLHFLLELTATQHGGHSVVPLNPTMMLLGHIGAGLLTGLLLAGAESALFLVARMLGWVLPKRPSSQPVTIAPAPALPCWAPIRLLTELTKQRIHALRGPPTLS